jgi:hypothetical protein
MPAGKRVGVLDMWRVASVAAISALCVAAAANAGEMQPPRITRADVDWASAAQAIGAVVASRSVAAAETPSIDAAMARINDATATRLPGIAQSPIPVLLPFDIDAFLRDHPQGGPARPGQDNPQVGPARPGQDSPQVAPARPAPRNTNIAQPPFRIQARLAGLLDPTRDADPAFYAGIDQAYYAGFGSPAFFAAGPSGFDATFRFPLAGVPELADIRFAGSADIAISGSSLTYDLDAQGADQGASVPALEADFPGIRRSFLEDYVRYTFVRYGVPYVVSTDCFDAAVSRFHHIACRDADRVIQVFLHKLRIVGGMPQATPQSPPQPATPPAPERPAAASPTFTYYGPGRLITGTGYRGNGGRTDYTVYSSIRFPLAEAPAFANTQYYAHRVAGGVRAYPWRDNFCESRSFYMSQCPGGLGHQGQDIGAGGCNPASLGDDRCTEHRNDVVAVRDGMILRAQGQEAVWLVVNTANEHIRFRYLHMRPKLLDASGMLSGRSVKAGEVIGQVGNFNGHENGTSYHLHFDVQVPTRMGWIYVNPYMTLVSAYERLIGGRGAELADDVIASATTTLNDAFGGPRFTLASVRHAILGSVDRVAPAAEGAPPHWRRAAVAHCGWRARHWGGCGMRQIGMRQMAMTHHFHGFRGNYGYYAMRRHYPTRAASWRFRRHHS